VGDVVVGISGIITMIGLMDGLRVGLITDGRGVGKGVDGIGVLSKSAVPAPVYSTAPIDRYYSIIVNKCPLWY